MFKRWQAWGCGFMALWLLLALPARAADEDGLQGRLASVGWLQRHLADSGLRLLDASPGPLYRRQHIPGAVNADLFSYGTLDPSTAQMAQRLRGWGVHPGQRIVVYDQGGTYMAARLFWDLVHHGLPAERLLILDGGLDKWRAEGGALTAEPTPAPAPGTLQLAAPDPSVRVRLPEILAASADPARHALIDALDPDYFYGGAAFFNRAGHLPHSLLMPASDFFKPDKTYKAPAEIARMLAHLGVRPEQQIHTYCGGGGAAAVPFFALKYLLGYPQVRLFQESQLGWLQDPRELPVWTYGAPALIRDSAWVKAWSSPMLQAFGLARLSIIDVRPAEAFQLGHLPQALNLPAQTLQAALASPGALASLLGQAGLDATREAVVVSDGGLTADAALAFWLLEHQGQQRVSIYLDSLDRWAELGHEVARPAADAKTAQARAYAPAPRPARRAGAQAGDEGVYPTLFIASGAALPGQPPAAAQGRLLHLPAAGFLTADGRPLAARDIWRALDKAGVPRYARIVLLADAPGDAAMNYLIFRLMGFADLAVWAP